MEAILCHFHCHKLKSINNNTSCPNKPSNRYSILVAILVALLLLVWSPTGCNSQCTEQAGCFPPVGNLAIGRTVNTSSACTLGTEYCTFVPVECFNCTSDTALPANINDNDEATFWVSQIGPISSTPTVLQFNFETEFLLEDTVVVFHSVRPLTMVLERSIDLGMTWQAYRYYSASCTDLFALEDTFITQDDVFHTTEPICTSTESLFFPFSGGRVTFNTVQHLSPNISREAATQYRTITNIRIRILGYFEELEFNSDSQVYYAISEWYINGQCKCNGHSDSCVPQPGEDIIPNKVYSGCACAHNTDGEQCERCATGFNNEPWSAGTQADANVCQECICNEHAEDCQYIPAQSSAVCINCTDNTAGDQCELCQAGFFQDMALLLGDPSICIACECSNLGAVNSDCNAQGQCSCKPNVNSDSVKCTQCLDGYWNLTQSNPDGCEVCDCASEGTITSSALPLCDKQTGKCQCTDRAEGRRCDQCRPEFYDLSSGCLPCDCNEGGSESAVCDQSSPVAQCPCKPNIDTTTCSAPFPGFYFRPLDSITFEAEDASFDQEQTQVVLPFGSTVPVLTSHTRRDCVLPLMAVFTGQGYIQPVSFSSIRFTLRAPQQSLYEIIIRYQTQEPVESLSVTLYSTNAVEIDLDCDVPTNPTNVTRFQVATLQPEQEYYISFTVCLDNSTDYKLLLEYTSFSPVDCWLLDSVVLLPAFSEISAYYQAQPVADQVSIVEPCLPRTISEPDPLCQDASFALSTEFFGDVLPCDCDSTGAMNNETCNPFGGSCAPCYPGVSGYRCDTCLNGWFGFSAGGCQECNCDSQGSSSLVCDKDSGQCDCQPGTTSRTCSECLPGFFNLTSAGCSPCSCSQFALSDQCDNNGQCSCLNGVGGLKCDDCLPEFYNISSVGCIMCQCDPFGSDSPQCDAETGQCPCTGNSEGLNCDECPDGSFLTTGTNRQLCVACVCSGKTTECVADESNFALVSFQIDFTTLCAADPTNCSSGWMLLSSDGQQAAPFGPSDSSGLGYILINNHQPMLFAPEAFLGNRLGSYDQTFSMVVSVGENSLGTNVLRVNTTIIRMVASVTGDILVGVFPQPNIQQDVTGSRILSFSIPMVEHYWHVDDRDGPTPSQGQFLSVLTDIGQLSFSADFTQDTIEFIHISNISFTSTFPVTEVNTTDIVIVAQSYPVEDCQCPAGFSGTSCQDCARGYARPSGDIRDSCVLCECNNQTFDCDVSSGICLNCAGNTKGDNCEQCVSGYYGDPTRGIPCRPCTCPLITNSFSATCFLDTDDEQTCDSCDSGYTGRNCEVCMDGFFGNPLIGFCNDCECNGNVDPAVGPVCNTTTGRCINCLNNTTGFNCGVCNPGFFGDPTLPDQPCQPCPCDPRGTMGDCDPLFGKCFCEPNVMGIQCNQCEDGYWGLSQGLGCIPCDCCSNGSLSGICDKDTGACSCLPNVGSTDDDKCCTCTPGYFNFTSSTGCEACNCSALATSSECDLITGRCDCSDGAIGLKCDECAFGFTGQAPNCERCHDCYFQWYDIISDLANRISDLRATIDGLITTYFNGYNLDSLRSELDRLAGLLEKANTTLRNTTLQESDLGALEDSLAQVNATLNIYISDIMDIQFALDVSIGFLERASAFDGTVNMSDVTQLQDLLLRYNVTITNTTELVNALFDMINAIQVDIYDFWQYLNNLAGQVQQFTADIMSAEMEATNIDSEVMDVQNTFNLLRGNISYLDSNANQLLEQIFTLSDLLTNTSINLQLNNNNVSSIIADIQRRLNHIDTSVELAQQLNMTVTSAYIAAMLANQRAQYLLAESQTRVNEANATLTTILELLEAISDIYFTLGSNKNTTSRILELRDLPVEQARQLSVAINGTILPEEFVDQIVRNASNSHAIALSALSTAQEALTSTLNASAVIAEIQQSISYSLGEQQHLDFNITDLKQSIDFTESILQEIANQSNFLSAIIADTQRIQLSTIRSIDNAHQQTLNGNAGLEDISDRTEVLTEEISGLKEGIDAAVDTYTTDSQRQIASAHEEADNTLSIVESLSERTQNVTDISIMVSVQELQDLMLDYLNESAQLSALDNRLTTLQQELNNLIASLTTAADRLGKCYNTP